MLGNILGDLLYFQSLSDIGVSRAAAITSTYPLVAAGISAFWLKEPLTMPLILGTASIVGGLILLRLEGTSAGSQARAHPVRGFLWALMAGVFWGMGIPITKWLVASQQVSPSTVNLWRSLVLLIFSGALWLWPRRGNPLGGRFRRLGTIPPAGWVTILASGGVSLGVAGFIFISVLRFAPASMVTPLTSVNPLLSTLFAVCFMGERLRRIQWIGSVLVVMGSAAVGM
jgi:DME family drug/metabolite transporter